MTETLNRHAQKSIAERDAAQQKFLETLSGLSDTLTAVADNFKRQQETAANITETLNRHAQKSIAERDAAQQKFLETLSGLSDTLTAVADNFKRQQETAAANITETLNRHAQQSAAERDAAQEKFLSTLSALSVTLNKLADKFKRQQEDAAKAHAAQISAAVNAFREIVDRHNATVKKTFDQIQKLLDESNKFLKRVDDAGTMLAIAAEPVKQSTAQLTRNLTETAAQMSTLADANRSTRQNIFDLSARLGDFVKNFNGIADELERSIKIIGDTLDNYNKTVSTELRENLREFDATMKAAIGNLSELVEDLNDLLELDDFKTNWRR